ncbi:unnamed protein product [Cuscuta europaea]|uniref:Uncharacterized protein n=1 Tax=Cuscuta europaea TaxID=41803 RepID=A0A9P1EFW0_CUSEU|nr:unnamed protein product [Cuscuta europaea]
MPPSTRSGHWPVLNGGRCYQEQTLSSKSYRHMSGFMKGSSAIGGHRSRSKPSRNQPGKASTFLHRRYSEDPTKFLPLVNLPLEHNLAFLLPNLVIVHAPPTRNHPGRPVHQ